MDTVFPWDSITNDPVLEEALCEVFGPGSTYCLEGEDLPREYEALRLRIANTKTYKAELGFLAEQALHAQQKLSQLAQSEASLHKSCELLNAENLSLKEAMEMSRDQIEVECHRVTEVANALESVIRLIEQSLREIDMIDDHMPMDDRLKAHCDPLETLYFTIERRAAASADSSVASLDTTLTSNMNNSKLLCIRSQLELLYLQGLTSSLITPKLTEEEVAPLKHTINDLMKELPNIVDFDTAKSVGLCRDLEESSRRKADQWLFNQSRQVSEIAQRSRALFVISQQITKFRRHLSQKEINLIGKCLQECPLALQSLTSELVSHEANEKLSQLPLLRSIRYQISDTTLLELVRRDA